MKILLLLTSLTFSAPYSYAVTNSTVELKANEESTVDSSLEVAPQDAYKFIYNRTFSFWGSNSPNTIQYAGTGWLIEHILPTDSSPSNYTYYAFTNWHVSCDMHKTLQIHWAEPDNGEEIPVNGKSPVNQYISISQNNIEWCDAWYATGIFEEKYGVDASLIKITFPIDNTFILNRLNNLNIYADGHNNLLFNGFFNYDDFKSTFPFYVGGYPAKKWDETQIIAGYPCWYTATDTLRQFHTFFNKEINHEITTDIYSMANLYSTGAITWGAPSLGSDNEGSYYPNSSLWWIGAGASGSMAIKADANGTDFELVGLYWGGSYVSGTFYTPCFEAFTWGDHNLLNDYKSNTWNGTDITNMEKKDDFIKIIVIVSIVVISVTVVGIILKVKGKSLGFGKSGKNKKSETGTI